MATVNTIETVSFVRRQMHVQVALFCRFCRVGPEDTLWRSGTLERRQVVSSRHSDKMSARSCWPQSRALKPLGVQGSGSRLSWDGCCHREPLDPSRQCSHCRRLSSEHQLREGQQVNPSLIVVFQLFRLCNIFPASTDILAFATNITLHASHSSIAS